VVGATADAEATSIVDCRDRPGRGVSQVHGDSPKSEVPSESVPPNISISSSSYEAALLAWLVEAALF
jgi:hypothetical protein